MTRNRILTVTSSLVILAALLTVTPAGAAPAVYLDETYSESPAQWTVDWYDADIGTRNRVSTIGDGVDGPGIRVSIPAGSHFGSAMHYQFADQGMPDPDELYYRYYLRVPDGPEHQDRGKLPGPAGLYSGSARNNIRPTDASPGWSARMFFSPTYDGRDSDHTQLGFYVYHRDQASNHGDLILWDNQTGTLRNGAWYCIEGHVDMNTPGQADGLLEGWVDEQLAFYQDDFKFRGSSDGSIDIKSFWFDVYYGGAAPAPTSYSFDFDSLVLSSERIGCGDSPTGGFRDTTGNTHAANIDRLAHAGITKGCNPPTNDLYCPRDSVTRGQMAAFLVRALALPASGTDYFDDDDGSTFEANINALAESGITKGCGPTSFCPNRKVTRAEMAAFLDRALELPAAPADRFEDDDGSIFEAAIDRLGASGITSGCNPPENTNFCPHQNVTRAQMASFLSRALSLPAPPAPPPGYVPPVIPDGFDAVAPAGWSIQEVSDSQPPGARILVQSGLHLRQQVVPKSGQVFVGEPGAVMDGLGTTLYAFRGDTNNVTVQGIEIAGYVGAHGLGAIRVEGTGWIIDDVDIHHNEHAGVSIEGGSTISNSHIHHNKQYGVVVEGGTGSTLADNEIAHNNYDQNSGDFFYAGARFNSTTNLTVRSNHVHHNHGYGLWSRQDNIDTLYEDNLVEDNFWAGIYHYRSYEVTITGNQFLRNGARGVSGSGDAAKFSGARISGPDATVTDNLFQDNFNAISIVGTGLDGVSGAHGPLSPMRTTVTGNTIIESGVVGIFHSPQAVYDTANFDHNTYRYQDTSDAHWWWDTWYVTFDSWQGHGLDLNGSLATP